MAEVATMFNEVLPLRSDQHLVFSQLLDAVTFCEQLGSAAWSITLHETGFRLNVGQVEAMTWSCTRFDGNETAVDQDALLSDVRILLAGADCPGKIKDLGEEGHFDELAYKSVGAQHWCYNGTFQVSTTASPDPRRAVVADHLVSLLDNHHQFLKLACTTSSGKLRQKSNYSQHHCESLYAYACAVVNGTAEPNQPDAVDTEEALLAAVARSLADSSEARAARLAVAPTLPERYQTTTTAYRRNGDVIAEVLLRAAGHCEGCQKPAPFIRAYDATPYLEVHHRVPLSVGGEDTVANAVGLCPNCHRAAHYA
ncbi:HNH endonuclease [Rhodoferax sp. PAMC 29310]|uniref:HNH endonuclease n=1 Tax=Rhodoferax sp. PAMC 29310 TaxID=2822760 RepID=UPI001F0A209A|nr:HNH endonuclease [Rhodoferax sp. PAMC 29310]